MTHDLPEPRNRMHRYDRALVLSLVAVVVGAIAIGFGCANASAAQEGLQEPGLELRYVRGWSVTLFVHDPAQYGWSHKRLSQHFAEHADCVKVKARMLPKVKGGRLECSFTDELMLLPVRE